MCFCMCKSGGASVQCVCKSNSNMGKPGHILKFLKGAPPKKILPFVYPVTHNNQLSLSHTGAQVTVCCVCVWGRPCLCVCHKFLCVSCSLLPINHMRQVRVRAKRSLILLRPSAARLYDMEGRAAWWYTFILKAHLWRPSNFVYETLDYLTIICVALPCPYFHSKLLSKLICSVLSISLIPFFGIQLLMLVNKSAKNPLPIYDKCANVCSDFYPFLASH